MDARARFDEIADDRARRDGDVKSSMQMMGMRQRQRRSLLGLKDDGLQAHGRGRAKGALELDGAHLFDPGSAAGR